MMAQVHPENHCLWFCSGPVIEGKKTSERLVLVKKWFSQYVCFFFLSFLFSTFCKTLVGSVKYTSVCVGLRNKKPP